MLLQLLRKTAANWDRDGDSEFRSRDLTMQGRAFAAPVAPASESSLVDTLVRPRLEVRTTRG